MNSPLVTPVVVGVDGSPSSLSAVRLAARHADSYGCVLHIVHAYNWVPRRPGALAPEWNIQAAENDVCPGAAANELIQRAVNVARAAAPGLAIDTKLLEGAPTSTLLRQARTAAMLAVGDGGLSGQICLSPHSSLVRIASRAVCSVLVARTMVPCDGPIVVGVNGSAASERALDFAFETAARRRRELVVVRATTSGAHDEDELRELADLIAAREDKYDLSVRLQVVHGEPEAVLVGASARAGLMIVGARGRQPYRGLLGSAAQTLLHHSPAPLILVRGLMPSQREDDVRTRTGRRHENGPSSATISAGLVLEQHPT